MVVVGGGAEDERNVVVVVRGEGKGESEAFGSGWG